MQGQLDVLNVHDGSGNSIAIARLLDHAQTIIQARIMRRDFEEQWPLPQAGPLPQDMYNATVTWVTSSEDIDDMYSSETSGFISHSSSQSSIDEDEGLDLITPSPSTPPLAQELITRDATDYLRRIQCRNCDKMGHFAQACPNPTITPLSERLSSSQNFRRVELERTTRNHAPSTDYMCRIQCHNC